MIVAAHQPSFLPWLGYLDKLAKADVFVVMDDLQYEAQNFVNRNRLKLANGPHWMIVPLLAAAQTDRIADMCKKLGASIYLSGRGGSTGYLDTEQLQRAGVATMWQQFAHPTYPQRYPHLGFVSHLGFLDLVLNTGEDAVAIFTGDALAQKGQS